MQKPVHNQDSILSGVKVATNLTTLFTESFSSIPE
jgi:hypothetical protein